MFSDTDVMFLLFADYMQWLIVILSLTQPSLGRARQKKCSHVLNNDYTTTINVRSLRQNESNTFN